MQFRNAPPGKCSGRRSSFRGSRQRVGGVGSSNKRWGGSNAEPLLQPPTRVARLFEGRRPATPAVGVARLLCRSGHDRFVAQVRIQPAHQALAARKRPRVCMLRVAARMRPGSSEGRACVMTRRVLRLKDVKKATGLSRSSIYALRATQTWALPAVGQDRTQGGRLVRGRDPRPPEIASPRRCPTEPRTDGDRRRRACRRS